MTTSLSPAPIKLSNNRFMILDNESDESQSLNLMDTVGDAFTNTNKSDIDDDCISSSSWSVVNSTYPSDDEEERDDINLDVEFDELYFGVSDSNSSYTLSTFENGFLKLDKVVTASSINSRIAQTAEGAWIIQQSKARKTKPSAGNLSPIIDVSNTEKSADNSHLEDTGMDISEYELSKSATAVNLKNIRLASAHDRNLYASLSVPIKPNSKRPTVRNWSGHGKRNGF